jgi:hypothetical protein
MVKALIICSDITRSMVPGVCRSKAVARSSHTSCVAMYVMSVSHFWPGLDHTPALLLAERSSRD